MARRVNRNARNAKMQPFNSPDGRLIEDVFLATGGLTDIEHGMGVVPRGYEILNMRLSGAAAAIATHPFEIYTGEGIPSGRTKTHLRLYNLSNKSMYVDLWVY